MKKEDKILLIGSVIIAAAMTIVMAANVRKIPDEDSQTSEVSVLSDTESVRETEAPIYTNRSDDTPTDTPTETEAITEPVSEIITETEIVAGGPSEYRSYCPLSLADDAVLQEVCAESGVPYTLALALIYTESCFDPYAVSPSGCYGYCQLNPLYFPSGLSPADNIRYGIGWLGELIEEQGDIGAALTVYNVGHDNGSRTYANIVIANARGMGYKG